MKELSSLNLRSFVTDLIVLVFDFYETNAFVQEMEYAN